MVTACSLSLSLSQAFISLLNRQSSISQIFSTPNSKAAAESYYFHVVSLCHVTKSFTACTNQKKFAPGAVGRHLHLFIRPKTNINCTTKEMARAPPEERNSTCCGKPRWCEPVNDPSLYFRIHYKLRTALRIAGWKRESSWNSRHEKTFLRLSGRRISFLIHFTFIEIVFIGTFWFKQL